MTNNPKHTLNGAVCLLVINKIEEMPEIAVRSILQSCAEKIFIGYKNYSDVQVFENMDRVYLINLSEQFENLGIRGGDGEYSGWSNDVFFQIVQLKWFLLEEVLRRDYDFVIYSDLDVVWVSDAFKEIRNTFLIRNSIDLQIQSFTRSAHEPYLCMGFVGLRNNENILEFINTAKERHRYELQNNPRIGDDDVVTILNREMNFPGWILELPQTAFPVGISFNLFNQTSGFPGLRAKGPFIFHANYVVGLNNKILLIKAFLGKELRKLYGAKYSLTELGILTAKRLKWFVLFRLRTYK